MSVTSNSHLGAAHRRIVIGDVHGHYDGLMKLLEAISPNSEDEVYFLGDLIDRGPKSSQVVQFVKDGGYPCLMGNHEQMLISVFSGERRSASNLQGWLYSGGQATVASYTEAKIPQQHLDWMKTLPSYIDLGDYWLVHAGVDPTMTVEEQSCEQFCWVRDEFHGINKPYFPNKTIIIGHTITFTLPGVTPGKLAEGPGWLGIDTGAYHPRSGWLTALDITNEVVYQFNVLRPSVRTLPLKKAVASVDLSQVRGEKPKKRA
jgi:serine/threonine protein phosphatase 1